MNGENSKVWSKWGLMELDGKATAPLAISGDGSWGEYSPTWQMMLIIKIIIIIYIITSHLSLITNANKAEGWK